MEEIEAPEVTPEEITAAVVAEEAELAPSELVDAAEEAAPEEEPVVEEVKVVKKSKKAAEPTPAEVPVVAEATTPVANPARVNLLNGMQISIK